MVTLHLRGTLRASHRYNRGLLDGVFFYRDSNQNEVDLLLKEEGEITAIEVKSSMTYHSFFADSIAKLSEWIKTDIHLHPF